jgi:hypothetical protein
MPKVKRKLDFYKDDAPCVITQHVIVPETPNSIALDNYDNTETPNTIALDNIKTPVPLVEKKIPPIAFCFKKFDKTIYIRELFPDSKISNNIHDKDIDIYWIQVETIKTFVSMAVVHSNIRFVYVFHTIYQQASNETLFLNYIRYQLFVHSPFLCMYDTIMPPLGVLTKLCNVHKMNVVNCNNVHLIINSRSDDPLPPIKRICIRDFLYSSN